MRARWLVVLVVASCTDVRANAPEAEAVLAARRWFAVDDATSSSRFARVLLNRTRLEADEPGVWIELSPRGGERLAGTTATTTTTVLADGWERLQFSGEHWYEDVVRLRRPMTGALRYLVELGPAVRAITLEGTRVVVSGARSEIATTPMVAIDARGHARALDARIAGNELQLSLDDRGLEYPVWIDPKWETKGSMNAARSVHTATLLPDGRVLVAGGFSTSSVASTSEIYDPTTGVFSTLRTFSPERAGATANVTSLGVLMVGGLNSTSLKSVVRFDLATTSWIAAAPLPTHDRAHHCAGLVGTGATERVLVFGGEMNLTTSWITLNDGYAFSTATGAWTATAPMAAARAGFACGVVGYLSDTRAYYLAAGGSGLSTTEIYDPTGNTWKTLGNLSVGRSTGSSDVLSDGRLVFAGGLAAAGPSRAVDLYDPMTATWTARASMVEARVEAPATALPNGDFVVASGRGAASVLHSSVEIYDPRTNVWTSLPPMSTGRQSGTLRVVSLSSGHWGVLAIGGDGASGALASTELLTLDVNGTACTVGATCESGFCADGVCCDAACDGSCEACKESGKEGTCTIVEAPRTGHVACPLTGTGACASSCNGGKTCSLPDSSKVCWSECAGEDAFVAKCDGTGVCSTPANTSCGAFKCVDKLCATTCTLETEAQRCKSTAFCASGVCATKKADGATCTEARECSSATCCATNGLCGVCPAVENGREVEEPWCSCRAPGAPGHGVWPLGLLVALRTARALARRKDRR